MTALRDALRALLHDAPSIRLSNAGALDRLGCVECIVILGATCAGKTTISNAVRDSALAREGRVEVPRRYVTRPPRLNDCVAESVHVTCEVFERLARERRIGLRWSRTLGAGPEERYGFPPVGTQALPVYSGNNAVIANASNMEPSRALRNALFVAIYAPDPVRERRLRERSPDLWERRPDEVAARLAERSADALSLAHVVVHNHGGFEAAARSEALRLVRAVVTARSGRVGDEGLEAAATAG